MERENFYLLLDLSIDPPETDSKNIEAAIARKQSEWSRLRNHPTKGLQAQNFISMIPEIRRVMKDPALREQEAEAAKENLVKDKADKITDIDRHIDILIGKGFISKEEIVRLAQIHGMEEKEVQDRIRIKKDEKFSRVDQQLSLRMAKGYVTEEEINKLAKRHNLKPEEVKSRVYIPMVKNGNEKAPLAPRQMDRSIEKAIKENLKIIDKASLYDFLELHESTDLETLQAAAVEKKKQLVNAGKKDARVTAGNILAGHCVTIFKNEETRISYDISLAKSKLAELDSGIDISGFNGKIRREYYDILVRKAMDFGMEKQEAEQYIRDYCKRKNWTIEQAKGEKRRLFLFGSILAVLLIAASSLGYLYFNYRQEHRIQKEYADLAARVASTEDPQQGIDILNQYIMTYEEEKDYADLVEDARRLRENRVSIIAGEKYGEMEKRVSSSVEDNDFETAKSYIDDYLKTNPPGQFAAKARKEQAEIESMAENAAFEKLSATVIQAAADEKISKITDYIEKYPRGKKTEEVRGMLADMSSEYYIFVKNALENLEEKKDWQESIKLAQSYIDLYDNSHADNLKPELERYQQNLRFERIFQSLRQQAQNLGQDHTQALQVYTNYLQAYPDSPINARIDEEIVKLRERIRQKEVQKAQDQLTEMIRDSGGRFVEKGDGVAADTETGLMWMLLDSDITGFQNCMIFDAAARYVENLSTGGYSDWRLPKMSELAGIYKKTPAFPVMKEKWFWSADSYSGYSEGWYRIVDTITVFPDGTTAESSRDSRECGVVKAVRNQ